MQPSITFGVTMATYCAQNLGAGNIERIKEGKEMHYDKYSYRSYFWFYTYFICTFIKMFVSNADKKCYRHC